MSVRYCCTSSPIRFASDCITCNSQTITKRIIIIIIINPPSVHNFPRNKHMAFIPHMVKKLYSYTASFEYLEENYYIPIDRVRHRPLLLMGQLQRNTTAYTYTYMMYMYILTILVESLYLHSFPCDDRIINTKYISWRIRKNMWRYNIDHVCVMIFYPTISLPIHIHT